MADVYGGTELPVPLTPLPMGDPALLRVGLFIQAVVNEVCGAAWAALRPREGDFALPIRNVFTHNPMREGGEGFNTADLPALYVYRERGAFAFIADEYESEASVWRALWVPPPDTQAKRVPREPFENALAKAAERALAYGSHPAWVDEGDTTPGAADVEADEDGLRLAASTPVAPATYSGVALDGALAGSTFSPRQAPTVTTTLVEGPWDDPGDVPAGDDSPGVTEVYNTTDPYIFICVDWSGRTVERAVTLTLPYGGETVVLAEDVAQVVSVTSPAHLSTLGTHSFGTAGFNRGRGSVLLTRANLFSAAITGWERQVLAVEIVDDGGAVVKRMFFPALRLDLATQEIEEQDEAEWPEGGVDGDVTQQGLVMGRFELP